MKCIKLLKNLAYTLAISFILFSCSGNRDRNPEENTNSSSTVEKIIEVRVTPKDGINIRKGPGTSYEMDESGQLIKGEKIYVLEEKDGWIRFRVTLKDVGWSGWIKKDLTILESQKASSKEEDDINTLTESGLLLKINPQMNEAYVNPSIWNALEYQTKENISRVLAFHCGRKKGNNLNWVEIKDSYSGKKLAKYSESWGFKTY